MLANKWGRIINIASAHGLVASPYKWAYVAAKHGIVGLTKVTAVRRVIGFPCFRSPDRQRATGGDLLDQAVVQEVRDHFLGNGSFPVSGEFNGAIRALRRGGQQHKLAIRKLLRCHAGISSVDDGVSRRHHRSPALAIKPAGQDPRKSQRPSGVLQQ
jgi:short subunit dehydrogenase